MTTQYIKFKNGHLQNLVYFLDGIKVTLKQNRMKIRFKNMIAKYDSEVVVPGKIVILEEFATKDENGKAIIADEETRRYLFEDPEQEIKARNELANFFEETYPIALDEYNKDMLVSVAEAVLSTLDDEEIKVYGVLGEQVEEWFGLFEYILSYYEKENKG